MTNDRPLTIDRLPTGAARLDSILGGGLPRNAINLVIGLPGSGKTILAQQCVYANATEDRPAGYFSTVSEPLEKILRFGQTLSFFDPGAVGDRVFYDDLGPMLAERGLAGVLDRLRDFIRHRRPGIIAIDSFKALRAYAATSGEFRQFLHTLSGMVSAFPVTSIWIGEYEANDISTAPEFAVADAIIALGTNEEGERSARALRVRKLRGGDFLSGQHAYRITSDGIAAYPRLADPAGEADYALSSARISSGIQALDEMLHDGYWPGASTLVAGPTGAGKTLMGLHFVFSGTRAGEPGVIATLQENPTQLERIVSGFGWSLKDDNVAVMYRTPVDLYVDQWVYDLFDTVEAIGAKRVLVDSLGDLQAASPDPTRFREYIYSLLHRFSRRGVSVMMTYEMAELYGATSLTEYGASHLADNVVLLQYVADESGRGDRDPEPMLSRTLSVLKTRASSHDPRIREFTITPDGITLDRRQR
ncbi:MAG TPA: ATPase domain-containing protein [Natronosporangium sp.]